MNECIICEEVSGNLVDTPTESSFETMLERTREIHRYRDQKVTNFAERTVVSPATMIENNTNYHRVCFKCTNKGKIDRVRKRYHEEVETGNTTVVKRKAGRPSLNNSHALEECEGLTTRSSGVPYMKEICIICQKQGGKLHRVEFKTTGQNMFQVSKMLTDKSFFMRSNTITSAEDAVANDVLYHNQYWVIAKRKAKLKSSKPEDYVHTLSETELINFAENYLQCGTDPVLDMNKVDLVYKNILIENGMKKADLARDHKRKLKEVIEDYVPNAVFVKSKHKNKPEQNITKDIQEEVVVTFIDDGSIEEDLQTMWKVAKKIRQDLLKLDWHFEGDMKDYPAPNILSSFLKWVLTGPHYVSDEKDHYHKVDILVSKISQLVVQNVKTDKQMRTLKTSENIRGYSTI